MPVADISTLQQNSTPQKAPTTPAKAPATATVGAIVGSYPQGSQFSQLPA